MHALMLPSSSPGSKAAATCLVSCVAGRPSPNPLLCLRPRLLRPLRTLLASAARPHCSERGGSGRPVAASERLRSDRGARRGAHAERCDRARWELGKPGHAACSGPGVPPRRGADPAAGAGRIGGGRAEARARGHRRCRRYARAPPPRFLCSQRVGSVRGLPLRRRSC